MADFIARSVRLLPVALFALGTFAASAKADQMASGWALDAGTSTLTFESEHSGSVSETHKFSVYSGVINPNGDAEIKIRLASVDTQDDMRDVRLRFLFFEAFQYPEATIRAQIDRADLVGLEKSRRAILTLPFTINLHGVTREMSVPVLVALGENNTVSVTPVSPVKVQASDFGFGEGLKRLEDAFYGTIRPDFSVGFKFVFEHYETDLPMLIAAPVEMPDLMTPEAETPAIQAPEVQAVQAPNFQITAALTPEMCEARLSNVTSTGQVTFQRGSYELADSSKPVLAQVVEIATECDGLTIRVEGHTDSVGKEASNQSLSERRAQSVAKYLVKMGLPEKRVGSKGLGEKFPVAPNDTPDNRAKNRRIEFHVDQLDKNS